MTMHNKEDKKRNHVSLKQKHNILQTKNPINGPVQMQEKACHLKYSLSIDLIEFLLESL